MPNNIKKRSSSSILLIGIGKEKDYLVENLSMMLASGMDISTALDALQSDTNVRNVKKIVTQIAESIEGGSTVSKSLADTHIFPPHVISLIKIGEESGKLSENLKAVVLQQRKENSLKGKMQSAMMYPMFVLGVTGVVGIGIAWFILPRLTNVFDSLDMDLPLITRVVIQFGKFVSEYGLYAVPIFVVTLLFSIYIVFFFHKTKSVGQWILFHIPGVKKVIQEIELSRFGSITGQLLESGMSVPDTFESLMAVSSFYQYRNLYARIKVQIIEGRTFHQILTGDKAAKKLIPRPIQQMIFGAEKSGNLAATFSQIGEIYTERTDNSSKNLSVMLEPILLVIVFFGVLGVALSVILPIYGLIGGLNTSGSSSTSTPEKPIVSVSPTPEPSKTVEILETGTNFLNVRDDASRSAEIITRVTPGERYPLISEQDEWVEIQIDSSISGWIVREYANIISE